MTAAPLAACRARTVAVRVGLVVAVAAATVLAVGATSSQASRPGDAGRFDTWVGYDVGRAPVGVEATDLDGDGRPDAVWVRDDFFDNTISVTLNLGEGTLRGPVEYPATAQSTDVAAADLDGDGDVDLAVSARDNDYQGGTVDLYLNDGAGRLTHETASAGTGPESITAGDVDDDDTDLVLANYNEYLDPDEDGIPSGTVSVLRNDGTADFTEERTVVGNRVHDTVVADVTGDGSTDVVAVRLDEDTHRRHELHVLEQGPNGSFTPDDEPQLFDVSTNGGVGAPTLSRGDLDADGDLDLVVGGMGAFEQQAVLLNTGDRAGTYDVAHYPGGTVVTRVVDLDGDGDRDIVGVGGGGGVRGTLSVRRNAGDGTFGAARAMVTGNDPTAVDVADLDGDARPDVLVASRELGTGIAHLQRGDGSFGAPPAGQLFAPSVDVATGDLDADGDQDVAAAVRGDFTTGDTIDVLQGDGSGALTRVDRVAAGGTDPRSLVVGDLDGDGDRDLSWLVGHGQFQRVATSLGDGTTYAAPSLHQVASCGNHLTMGDVDDDGDLDQLVGSDDFGCGEAAENEISVSLNPSDGDFAGARQLQVPMVYFTAETRAVDVDRDGVTDLVAGGAGQGGADDVAVALGDGRGGFGTPILTSTGARHRELVVRDLDGDGALDIASSTYDEGTVVLLGDGTGEFPTARTIEGEQVHGYRNAVGIAVGDIDGDAIDDIVVANESGSDLAVHAGFGDGTFDPRQVRYGMRPRVTDVELADLDSDGVLDVVSPAQLPQGGAAAADRTTPAGRTAAAGPAPAPGLTVLLGAVPQCTVRGTPGPDLLAGTRRSDVVCGFGGDDVLRGFGAADILRGGTGDDRLVGGPGVDVLSGGDGGDALAGGDGADLMRGAAGPDDLLGGAGRDVVDLLDRTRGNDSGGGGLGRDHCRSDRGDTLASCP